MNHQVEFKGFDSKTQPAVEARELIESLAARLSRKTKGVSEPVYLRVMVEVHPAHKLYHVSLTLEVPGKTLAAKQEGHDVKVPVRLVFDEIERELEDYKSGLRGEHLWKRLARRAKIRQMKSGAASPEHLNDKIFFGVVSPHLNELNDFVRHEIAYAEAEGDLVRGELTTEDVVDAALIRAHQEFVKDPVRVEIRSWLIKLAIEQLEAEIKRSKSERARMVRIEEGVPEAPPAEEVTTLGDEILDFYQPDQALKVEDIVPDIEVPTPEQEAERAELRQSVNSALGAMPRDYRRLVILHYFQELTVAELATATGRARRDVEHMLEKARGVLRQKLIEAGCTFKSSASRTSGARS